MSTKRISEYFENEVKALLQRYSNIESLIPKVKRAKNSDKIAEGAYHTGEEGRFLEELLKSILNKHLPKGLRSITGFILRPATQIGENDSRRIRDQKIDLHSPQLDIIVYDVQNYPVFETFGDFSIVPPEGVIGIISAKKHLYFDQIESEIRALNYSASLCWGYNYRQDDNGYKQHEYVKGPITALITFKNKSARNNLPESIFDVITNCYSSNTPADSMIKQISIINEMTLFRGKSRLKNEAYRTPFLHFKHAERINFPIQMLLRSIFEIYYDRTRSSLKIRPGYIDFDEKDLQDKTFRGVIKTNKLALDFDFMDSIKGHMINGEGEE